MCSSVPRSSLLIYKEQPRRKEGLTMPHGFARTSRKTSSLDMTLWRYLLAGKRFYFCRVSDGGQILTGMG